MALNRTTTGLLLREAFDAANGWTAGTGFTRENEPAMVCFTQVYDWLGPNGLKTDSSSEYNGTRDPQLYIEGGTWYLFVDSGNDPIGGIHGNSSTDRGLTWTRNGRLSNYNAYSGGTLSPGSAWSGWFEKRGSTYYNERICGLSSFASPDQWIPIMPGFGDVWTASTPFGTWTRIADINTGSTWNAESVWPSCMVFDGTNYVRFLGGRDNPVTSEFIGYEYSTSRTGPWTRSTSQIDQSQWPYSKFGEELRVFYHPDLARWIGLCNLVNGTGGQYTDGNGQVVSTDLGDWTSAKLYFFQRGGAVCDTTGVAIGMPAHATGPDGALIQEDGFVPFVWDADAPSSDDWGSNSTGYHRGRHIKAGVLEPAAYRLRYSDATTTRHRYNKSLSHTNIIAEFEVDFDAMATGADISFEFRTNGTTGYRLMVRADNGNPTLRLEDMNGNGTILNGTGSQVVAARVFHRIKVSAQGTTIKAWLDGEQQITATDSTYNAGPYSEVAISGKNVAACVRLLHARTSDALTVRGLGAGEQIYLRTHAQLPVAAVTADGSGVATYSASHYPISRVQISSTDYQATDRLLWGGDDITYAASSLFDSAVFDGPTLFDTGGTPPTTTLFDSAIFDGPTLFDTGGSVTAAVGSSAPGATVTGLALGAPTAAVGLSSPFASVFGAPTAVVATVSDPVFVNTLRQNRTMVILADLDFVYQGSSQPAVNVAAASNGGVATASSEYSGGGLFPATGANDGILYALSGSGNVWGSGMSWNDDTSGVFPDWWQVVFSGTKTINRVVVYSAQDGLNDGMPPFEGEIGTLYTLVSFDVQGWNGAAWYNLASVTGNNLIKRTVTFANYTGDRIRISVNSAQDGIYTRIVEVEAYTADPSIGTARIGNYPYFTGASDTPANAKYRDVITSAPKFSRQIDRTKLCGKSQVTVGDLVLNNAGGQMDWLLDAIIDGQEIRFKMGDPSWPIADFRSVFTAVMERAEITKRGEITIRLRDRGLLIDQSVVGTLIGGSTVNSDKPAPILLGWVKQSLAMLSVAALNRYIWCDAAYFYGVWDTATRTTPPPRPVIAAKSDGASLGPDALTGILSFAGDAANDRINVTGTVTANFPNVNEVIYFTNSTATVPGGLAFNTQYWVVAVGGVTPSRWFQLSATRGGAAINVTSNGTIDSVGSTVFYRQQFYDNNNGTIDLSADAAEAVITVEAKNYPFTGGQLGHTIMTGRYSWLYSWLFAAAGQTADWWSGRHVSWDVSENTTDEPCGITLLERTNLAELANKTAESSVTFWGTTRLGKFTFGQVHTNPPQISTDVINAFNIPYNTPVMSFTDDDVIMDDARVDRLMPMWKTVSGWTAINYPPLTKVAASVAADLAQRYMGKGQRRTSFRFGSGSDYSNARERYHLTMVDSPEYELLTSWDSSYSCAYRDALFFPHIEFLSFTAPLRAYSVELGDMVLVNMPLCCRHTSAAKWVVIGVDIALTERKVGLVLVRKRTVDYSTATHI